MTHSRPSAHPRCIRANRPSVLRLGLPVERRLRCAGKINFDSTSENIRQGITTNGICAKISPRLPSTINSGTKAMAVVSTPKITGTAISCVPLIAPVNALPPRCWWAWMQSPVTMASSTKMPRTRRNPYSVKRLIVTPRYGISAKAPIKATGTPTQTHIATAGRRNNPSNTIMNPIPINAESLRVTRRFLIMSARLFHTSMETPSGSCGVRRAR